MKQLKVKSSFDDHSRCNKDVSPHVDTIVPYQLVSLRLGPVHRICLHKGDSAISKSPSNKKNDADAFETYFRKESGLVTSPISP